MVIKKQNLIKTLVSVILLSSLLNSNAMNQVDDTSVYDKAKLAPSSLAPIDANNNSSNSTTDIPKRPASR